MDTRQTVAVMLSSLLMLVALPLHVGAEPSPMPGDTEGASDPALQAKKSAVHQRMIASMEGMLERNPALKKKAEVLFRLAELHYEESRYRHLLARQKYRRELARFQTGELPQSPTEPQPDLTKALAFYRAVLSIEPHYERLDEALLHFGRAALDQGKATKDDPLVVEGVAALQRLVKTHPDSKFVPNAHATLADHLFEADKLPEALVHYDALTGDAKLGFYARYKRAWIFINLGKHAEAAAALKGLVADPSTNAQVGLRQRLLNDLATALAGTSLRWREAVAFYQEVSSGDSPPDAWLVRLAEGYVAAGNKTASTELHQELVKRAPENKGAVQWYGSLFDAAFEAGDAPAMRQLATDISAKLGDGSTWVRVHNADAEAREAASDLVTRSSGVVKCRTWAKCASEGACTWSEGTCKPASTEECGRSPACETSGACVWRKGACRPGSTDDCRKTEGCPRYGSCKWDGEACRPGSASDCAKSDQCKREGHCGLKSGRCTATAKGCKRSDRCESIGYCYERQGDCVDRWATLSLASKEAEVFKTCRKLVMVATKLKRQALQQQRAGNYEAYELTLDQLRSYDDELNENDEHAREVLAGLQASGASEGKIRAFVLAVEQRCQP